MNRTLIIETIESRFRIGDDVALASGIKRRVKRIEFDAATGRPIYVFESNASWRDEFNLNVSYVDIDSELADGDETHNYRVEYNYVEFRAGFVQAKSFAEARKLVMDGQCDDSNFICGGEPTITGVIDEGAI